MDLKNDIQRKENLSFNDKYNIQKIELDNIYIK
jgi:hypothetical protein